MHYLQRNHFGSYNIDDAERPRWTKRTLATGEFDFEDEAGRLLFQVRKGVNELGEKVFMVRRPNLLNFSDRLEPEDKRDWYHDMRGVRRVLFNLPALVDPTRRDEVVWIAEGEKDAMSLIRRGLIATTNFGGAGKWADEYSDTLTGRDCVILPDNDPRGWEHADMVWRSLRRTAVRVRVLKLPNLPPKGDVSDWLDLGGTVEELRRLADTASIEVRRAS
ncbi:hypothetical protein ABGN05_07690 [Aquibium sp. LZ166]|uniref:Toprim domain-containing protein n=1 Tax=Aquibium pacificus TaxID=3153579 RepID=A0ABV3SFN7_9HYPH